jgi:hypothetical protein
MSTEPVGQQARRRGLSPEFIKELLDPGSAISPLLGRVKRDSTLSLEIRDGYFNLYYRGGNLARVTRKAALSYTVEFDPNYLGPDTSPDLLVRAITSPETADAWLKSLPHLKDAMDLWFGAHPKDEREYQQLVVRDNNLRQAGTATDYFICDLEYARPSMRFDLVAVHWPSTGADRKRPDERGLAVIELKVLDGALGGSAGLAKHLEDYRTFVGSNALGEFQKEMRTIFELPTLGEILRGESP